MYLNKKEAQAYRTIIQEITTGRILTPDGLRLICEANDFDPLRIGIHFLEVNRRFQNDEGCFKNQNHSENISENL